MKQGSTDDFQTPDYALNILIPYLKKEWTIWECACGNGNLVKGLEKRGFQVIGSDIVNGVDFITSTVGSFDCIVTNPPYSLKDKFLERCYCLEKPFALLIPLTSLEGQSRQNLFRKHGLQLIIPNRRIDFYTPSGKNSSSWFQSAWFTSGLNLINDINFVEITDKKKLVNLKIVEKCNVDDWL